MKFERYDERAVRGRRFEKNRAILTKQGILTFNRAAITDLNLDGGVHLVLHYAEAEGVIGLRPVDAQEAGSRKLSISKSSANLSMAKFLSRYGLKTDVPIRYEPTYDEEHGMILIRLREPVDVEPEAGADGRDED
ncbi:MAG: hypothetical protein HN396_14655 [Gemmatimonadales bacterium]|jgi:hypothetical protein|nr:hypothetical protein [Gemmatimonadales bacterium]